MNNDLGDEVSLQDDWMVSDVINHGTIGLSVLSKK
jgi:hypothetical protein